MSISVNIHILQTVPPSCLNRDDTGTPKTAVFGGYRRHRVSSQAWKKATRELMKSRLSDLEFGVREKLPVFQQRLAEGIQRELPSIDQQSVDAKAAEIMKALKSKEKKETSKTKESADEQNTSKSGSDATMSFMTSLELESLIQIGVESLQNNSKIAAKTVKECLAGNRGVDIALFGRMLADSPFYNVDAACQVAHAISVAKASVEFDFFTTTEDEVPEESSGAAFLGFAEYISSTLYRYINIDVERLIKNIGSPEVAYRTIGEAIRSFVLAMPTGKQNAYAARTRPDCVLVEVRTDQPTSWVGAFERPIDATKAGGNGVMLQATKALLDYSTASDTQYGTKPAAAALLLSGTLTGKVGSEMIGDRTVGTLDEVIETVVNTVSRVKDN